MTPAAETTDAAQRLAAFYRRLTPQELQRLEAYYAADARFRDPFNDVTGVPAIRAVFEHMFHHLDAPAFEVRQVFPAHGSACLLWRFGFAASRLRGGRRIEFDGVSVVSFNAAGLVDSHIDYWDPADAIYRHIPVVRGILAMLTRRLQARGAGPDRP